jgi:ribosomal protein L32
LKIYLAGKVAGDKWKLFTEDQRKVCHIVASDGGNHSEHAFGWAIYDWDYCNGDYKGSIKSYFIEEIVDSTHLIAYLDSPNSYGSIAEIGYAVARGIPCHVFLIDPCFINDPNHIHGLPNVKGMFDAYWFVCSFPGVILTICTDLSDAKEKAQDLIKRLGYKKFNYKEYLQGDRWRDLRRTALQRAGFHCQMCDNDGELHVHHRSYKTILTDREPMDLIVLCKDCHAKYHDKVTRDDA